MTQEQDQGQDFEKRTQTFFEELVQEGKLYFLTSEEDSLVAHESAVFSNHDDTPLLVVPVWTSAHLEDARAHDEEAKVGELSIQDFFYGLLPQMVEDNVVIGLNWDESGSGEELEPEEIISTLQEIFEEENISIAQA